ncbi:hypothetical protein [Massilia sp. TWR1-2-2]|uniref:hypothetical protein n=1 Tax=Massilia sp. TWR1-2-2 TaxID=2804584 RepID=UPI003CE7B67F
MMYASVQVGGRNYGGYFFTKASMSVEYTNVPSAWRYANKPEFLRAFMVEEWVGRSFDFSIAVKRTMHADDFIGASELVAPGSTITEEMAVKIGENAFAIAPESLGFQVMREFEEWWASKGQHRFINSDPSGPMVGVRITDLGISAQQGGEIQLTPQAAEWLGLQLLKYARGQGAVDGQAKARFPSSVASTVGTSTASKGGGLRVVRS